MRLVPVEWVLDVVVPMSLALALLSVELSARLLGGWAPALEQRKNALLTHTEGLCQRRGRGHRQILEYR